jgi:F0F1-type ATP synthase delta subunit
MRGVSRASFAELSERLSAEHVTSATVATRLANELFAVVGLLDTEHGLRRALSDPGKPAAEKAAVAGALLHGKITQRAEALVVAAVEAHWATSGDLVDAIEQLAVEAMVLAAEADSGLDDLEDGLFRFGRVVSANPDLRAALADPSLPEAGKRRLLDTLLQGHRGDAQPGQPDGGASARADPGRCPGPVRRDRGAAQAAADRGGPLGDRAVREPAQAARRRPGPRLRARYSPGCCHRSRGGRWNVRPDRG